MPENDDAGVVALLPTRTPWPARWSVFAAVLPIACVLLWFACADAHAGWLPPVDVSEPVEHAGVPDVALDSAGEATAVWEQWNGEHTVVEAAYRPPGGAWKAPTDIAPSGAYSPHVSVDAAGDATVVWARYAGTNRILIESIYRPTGGSWQAPVVFGEMHSAVDPEPWVASDEAGDTVAVWKSDEAIDTAYRPAGGSWGSPTTLSSAESFVPQAAIDARGDATVVWMHYDGTHYVVEGAFKPTDEGWGPSSLLSAPGEEAGDPQIALGGDGNTIVAWDGHPAGGEVVRAAFRPAHGSWQTPVDVSNPGDQAQSLRVALDEHGDALLVWSRGGHELGGYDTVQSSYRPAGGEWQEPVDLSEGGANAYPSDVVFDTQGNAAVVWQRPTGPGRDVVQADYRPTGGGWQAPVSLSTEDLASFDAVVVLDAPGDATAADGDATAVWITEEGTCLKTPPGCESPTDRIEAAGYDAIESPATLEAPTVGEVGVPVTVSGPSLDAWSPLLEFGDGAEAATSSATHTYTAPGTYTVQWSANEVLGYQRTSRSSIVIGSASKKEPPPPAPETTTTENAPTGGSHEAETGTTGGSGSQGGGDGSSGSTSTSLGPAAPPTVVTKAQTAASCKAAPASLLKRNAAAERLAKKLTHNTRYAPLIRTFKPKPTSTRNFTGYETIVVRAPKGTTPVVGYFTLPGAEPCAVIVTSASVVLSRNAYVVKLEFPGEQGNPGRLSVALVWR